MEHAWSDTLERYKAAQPTGETTVLGLRPPAPPAPPANLSNVSVVNADTLDTALLAPNTLLLNMANPSRPGGNPALVGAQEEDLFRRTNLHRFLVPTLYPLHNKIVLSKHVEVVKKGLREAYAPLDAPAYVDIVSCAAVQNAHGELYGAALSPLDARKMAQKIWNIFLLAKEHKYARIVLSAFGCGGFQCPPEHVSRLFRDVLCAFHGDFEEIVFAIWDECSPCSNYAVFKKTLCPTTT